MPGGPSRPSAPSRGQGHREHGGRLGDLPTVRSERPRPGRVRDVAAVHVGRLRRPPDHLPGRAGGHRHDHPPGAGLRPALGDRLRGRARGPPRALRPAARRGGGRRARSAVGLHHLPLAVVQRRARRAHRVDHRVHARPHAPPVARCQRRAGRPARAVLRSDPARSGRHGRRGTRRDREGPAAKRVPRPRGGRRGWHTVRLRRSPPVHQDGDAAHPPRPHPVPHRRGGHLATRDRSRASSWPRAAP